MLTEFLALNNKKVIIFDFDETIAWAKIDWASLYRERHKLFMQLYSKQMIQSGYGEFINEQTAHEISARYEDVDIKKLMEIDSELEQKYLDKFVPNPELISFILNDYKYQKHVWSSNTQKLIRKGLMHYGIEDKFQSIISKEEVKNMKPSADGFQIIKSTYKDYSQKDFLMIGNSIPADKGAAINANIDFFHVDYF